MTTIKAVLWDYGGVISESPFESFARYEREHELPEGFLRGLNATNSDANAWARLERNEVTFEEFCAAWEGEAAAAGYAIGAAEVMTSIIGGVRPEMVEAARRCNERLRTALITNNWNTGDETFVPEGLFDVVIESSKVGVRKPDPRIYELACAALGVIPTECVFLDDLGINLKPARALGMTTIKVVDPDVAIAELEQVVGIPLRKVAG